MCHKHKCNTPDLKLNNQDKRRKPLCISWKIKKGELECTYHWYQPLPCNKKKRMNKNSPFTSFTFHSRSAQNTILKYGWECASTPGDWVFVQLCIMGGKVGNYLRETEMRALLYCVLWHNKSFYYNRRANFYCLVPGAATKWARQASTGTRGHGGQTEELTVFGRGFERGLWVSGSKGVPDEATSAP